MIAKLRNIYIVIILLLSTVISSCGADDSKKEFVRVENGRFIVDGEPYYFIGTNFWFGAILGSQGEGGDRKRLVEELDFLKSIGINNLRVLVGADGQDGVPTKVMPTLQKQPGIYNDEIFDGLDFLLFEMAKRDMYAVLFFTNSWEWSGGYSQYLEWTGHGKAPIPSQDGWDTYIKYVEQYAGCDDCTELLKKHITSVITRTNRYSGKKYVDDPTIFSWQICNEPHAFGDSNKQSFEEWMKEVAAHIRSLDANHMISSGSEGIAGSEFDSELYQRIHTESEIDYLTLHIWPLNWGWVTADNMAENIDDCIDKTNDYIKEHVELGDKYKMPVVIEEFGFPRDGRKYTLDVPTVYRDRYMQNIFSVVLNSARENGSLAGCNFWAWGGKGRPTKGHIYWAKGDDYLGDPAQEEQGLNAVFDTDSTVPMIKCYVDSLNSCE